LPKVNKIAFEGIIFDLDGTLLDTLADIANSVNAALTEFDLPTHAVNDYRYLVGDGRDMLIERVLPENRRDKQTVTRFAGTLTDQYRQRWAENTVPYPGVSDLLTVLEQRGLPKAILSNKPHEFTVQIVDELLSDWSFNIVLGLMPSVPRKPDPAGAFQIADELGIPPKQFFYLGDTNTDMQTANAADMFAAGALWGFRTADELLQSGAKTVVQNPLEVLDLLG
jgi:phosphoglycolate phosphatase